jgi:N-acetylglutamate synthase-like GNAT family acetyltransferase
MNVKMKSDQRHHFNRTAKQFFKFELKDSLNVQEKRKISKIHYNNIFNGKIHYLGLEFIELLYIFFSGNNNFFFCLCSFNKIPIGFVTFTIDNKSIYKKFLFINFKKIILFIIKNFYNFSIIKNFLYLCLASIKFINHRQECELLSIAIEKKFRRKMIATKLIKICEKHLSNLDIKSYIVKTEEHSIINNLFYKKNNFKKIKTLKLHSFNMNFYKKKI